VSVLYKGTDVGNVIQLLPADQIKHVLNVGLLVDLLSTKLIKYNRFLSNLEDYKYFGSAALYHDIGKACIPQEILIKPGRLTPEEYMWMQKHTLFSDKIFQSIIKGKIYGIPEHLISLAHDAALYHHEWWNGEGYPFGISRNKIPLIARVTSVCDAYDAMTGDRVYKKSQSHSYACGELERCAGTQFDPLVVLAFLDNETEFKSAFESNLDLVTLVAE